MATRYFKFEFKQGKTNDLVKMIRNYNKIYSGVTEQLKRVNQKELKTIYVDAIMDRLSSYNVRFGKRLPKILRGFKVYNTSKNRDNQLYKFTHDYFEGADHTFVYNSSNNQHKVKGSTIIKLLNYGRENYVIPSTSNLTASSPLVWYYGKRPKGQVKWDWKSKRRRIHVMRKKSKIYSNGTLMLEAGVKSIADYINEIRDEIRKRMKGN